MIHDKTIVCEKHNNNNNNDNSTKCPSVKHDPIERWSGLNEYYDWRKHRGV